MNIRIYKIRVDDADVDIVELTHEQYSTQAGRDKVRSDFVERNGLASTWGVRLIETGRNYIMWTDMDTGETHRKYVPD